MPEVTSSPEFSKADLLNQIAALRAELRDGRVLQARPNIELNAESARFADLTQRFKEAKREQIDLATKLNNERDEVAAIRKRFNVAVKNHAEAQDKCARTMAECERLCITNEKLNRQNQELRVLGLGDRDAFNRRLNEVKEAFHSKLDEAKAALARNFETSKQEMLLEWSKETQTLRKELDNRDSKIKKLERDFNRQCEINAMFTINYDRDTSFTKRLHVPLSVPAAITSELASASNPSNRTRASSLRSPLANVESNRKVQSRKRPYAATGSNDKVEHSPSKVSKSSSYNSPDRRNSALKEVNLSHSHSPLRVLKQLPTPDGSPHISKRSRN